MPTIRPIDLDTDVLRFLDQNLNVVLPDDRLLRHRLCLNNDS
jgi:hypothetical protein